LVRRQENQKTSHRRHRSGFVAFPIYNKNKIDIKEEYSPGIYVEQQTIGFVGLRTKYRSFDLEDLQFNLLNLMTNSLLQPPSYFNQTTNQKKETLLTYQNMF
jgi:hypothetical protein